MSGFQTPLTIGEVLAKIHNNAMAMPAIQRDYEWDADRVCWLFDSLMREYPISSFLFWNVQGKNVGNYKFYRFLKDFREDFRIRGEEHDVDEHSQFEAVLDGQQRLTSLYIGFYGSYAWRAYYGRRDIDNETSRPTRKLYLNLSKTFAPDEDEQGRHYDFQFKTKGESENFSDIYTGVDGNRWFRVGKAISIKKVSELSSFISSNGLDEASQEVLCTLWDIKNARAINYYLEEDPDLQKALDIFIRINKGGAELSTSTIILSIAISYWHGDAKKAFDNLRDAVLREGFVINNDFILKAFLFLTSPDIKFKVTNFRRDTAEHLERDWENIQNSIIETFRTIKRFGYNDQRLPSQNVLLPIIYYIYHIKAWDGFSTRRQFFEDRKQIQNWMHKAIVHRIVSGSSDTVLTKIRKAFTDDLSQPLRKVSGCFPVDGIRKEIKTEMALSDEFLDNLVHLQKDDKCTFAALALLFPNLDYRNSFHKDHLHPESAFKQLTNVSDPDKEFFTDPFWWNSIINLQMLEGNDNESKNGQSFELWFQKEMADMHISETDLRRRCIIPDGVSLRFEDFPTFARARKSELINRFRQVLA